MSPTRRRPLSSRPARAIRSVDQPFETVVGEKPNRLSGLPLLLDLWSRLSLQGRKAVLMAAGLTAYEEGVLPPDAAIIPDDEEVR
jgi:hypothetical protein